MNTKPGIATQRTIADRDIDKSICVIDCTDCEKKMLWRMRAELTAYLSRYEFFDRIVLTRNGRLDDDVGEVLMDTDLAL
jgi:hypothetical protein